MTQADRDGLESLASQGARTLLSLQQTLTALTRLPPTSKFLSQAPVEIVSEEITRFKLWSGNIGLLHRGHASLDYRLRDAPAVERFVRTLLGDLLDAMSSVQEVVSGQRLPFEEMVAVDSEDELSGSDQELDSGIYSSETKTELGSRIEETKGILDRLFRLSTKIRNPASRVGHSKALLFKDVDRETGIDILEAHAAHDKMRIQEILQSLRNGIGLDVEPYGTFLVERLSEANKRRRQQFRYWKKHREKLARHEVKDQGDAPLTARVLETVESWTVADRSQHGTQTHTHMSLPTTATALVQDYIDLDDSKSLGSTYSAATSILSDETSLVEAERLMLPPPPVHLLQGKYFECPYCFTLCPKRYLQDKYWREHLWRDLRPYVCTYEDCQEASQLYDNKSDWIKHENWSHRRIWRCSQHAVEFVSEDDYKTHMNTAHDLALGKSLDAMAISATAAASSSRRNCPFCLVHLSKVGGSPERHISRHLERTASFTLPHSTVIDEDPDDEVTAAISGKANTAFATSAVNHSELSLESISPSLSGSDRSLLYEGEELEQVIPPDLEVSDGSEIDSTPHSFLTEPSLLLLANDMNDDNTTSFQSEPPDSSYSSLEFQQLYSACEGGDFDLVSLLLHQNPALGQNVWPLLRVSTTHEHKDVTKALWDHTWRRYPAYIRRRLIHADSRADQDSIHFLLDVLCQTGDAEAIRSVLDYVSISFVFDPILMSFAIEDNHAEVVKVLLQHRRDYGLPPNALYRACELDHYETVSVLLEGHANPNGNVIDYFPLHAASMIGSERVVKLLLSCGAIIDQAGQDGTTPLHIAAEKGHEELLRLLLLHTGDPDMVSLAGSTPLHAASMNGRLSVIRLLIENGASVDHRDTTGRTALFEAIKANHADVIKLLLDKGADINLHDEKSWTPLHQAALSGHFRVATYLIDHGADVNAICTEGEYVTPLLAACASDMPDLVTKLLQSGADPRFTSRNNRSILSLACIMERVTIVKIVLDHTASLPRDHPYLMSAFRQIAVNGRHDLVRLVSAYGIKPDGCALAAAVDNHSPSMVETLINAGVGVDTQYGQITPLGRAIEAGDTIIVETLVELGADVNKSSWFLSIQDLGRTTSMAMPLEIARSCGLLTIETILVENGALPVATGSESPISDSSATEESALCPAPKAKKGPAYLSIPLLEKPKPDHSNATSQTAK